MRPGRKIREGFRWPRGLKQRPHFFKIIGNGSMESGQLMIPIEFTRELVDKMADVAVLKVPTGRKWQVEVKEIDESVRFQNGWQGFMEYHSISVGDFLLFRYDGNSTFSVFIFNQGACEIDYPSNTDNDLEESNLDTECLIPIKKELEVEDYVEPVGVSVPFQLLPSSTEEVLDKAQELWFNKRRPGRRSSARKQRRNCKHHELRELGGGTGLNRVKGKNPIFDVEDEMEVIDVPSDNPNIETSMSISTETSSLSMGDDAQHGSPDADNSLPLVPLPSSGAVSLRSSEPSAPATQEVEPATEEVGSNCLEQEYRSKEFSSKNSTSAPEADAGEHLEPSLRGATNRLVTNQQRQKVICAAQMIKPKNPSVVIIMKPSYVYKGMVLNFPKRFLEKYLNYGNHNVKLSISDGRTWIARCYLRHRKATLTGGWRKFVLDNKLEEGDCCIFERTKARDVAMELKISIFRAVEEEEPV
ncbi:hypothetical protein NE237_018067 [Protea cynaroides]|uniref:TF-B3 domain-containing protein n=1 Tax=Protea cynaroides TaxID=273540 RepID=A0A9Q0K964_9MAGN|nr:hypothetical protein NE237_018067 [Protea cynaroides]